MTPSMAVNHSAGTVGVNETAMVTGMEAKHRFTVIKLSKATASLNNQTTSSRILHCTLIKADFLKKNSQPIGGSFIMSDTFYQAKVVIDFKKSGYFGFGFAFPDLTASTGVIIQRLTGCPIYPCEILQSSARTRLMHNTATAQHSAKRPISWDRRCSQGHMTIISTSLTMFLIVQKQIA